MGEPDRHASVNIGRWIADRAEQHPRRTALIHSDTEQSLTYEQLERSTRAVAEALRERGVVPGDRVALVLRSEPLYLMLYFAVARLGAVLVPLNTRLTVSELAFQIDDCRPRLVIHAGDYDLPHPGGSLQVSVDAFRDALATDGPNLAPVGGGEDPQVILYTSGTTGTPRGAVLPHRKTLYNTLNAEIYFGLRESDVVMVPLPLFHSFGLKILSIPALFAGATVVLVDRFDACGLQACIARYRATLIGAVPVMYRRMCAAGLDAAAWSSLRFAFSAGAPLDTETVRGFYGIGVALTQGYGQTETSILCTLDPDHALDYAGSVGRAVRHSELRIADQEGRALPTGEVGEILVRGPQVMLGYWETVRNGSRRRSGAWHRTGDLARMDEEGFVTIVGRRNDLYISGGENVYPAEVERVLREYTGVADVAVLGVADERWGETGQAYVVPVRSGRASFDTTELLRWARERLAPYKLPRKVILIDQLPRTASGKVKKYQLLDDFH